jgi:hypothetical protein
LTAAAEGANESRMGIAISPRGSGLRIASNIPATGKDAP